MSVFYGKAQKTGYLLFMGIFTPLAVRLDINWPKAYYFVANKCMRKFYKMSVRPIESRELYIKLGEKAKTCLEKYIAHTPKLQEIAGWIKANIDLGTLFLYEGNFRKYIDIFHHVEKVRQEVIKRHHLDKLDIEFIPIAFATGCIGTPENLDAYIKAEMLGLRPRKKLILLLDPKATLTNRCYLNYWSRYITIIADPQAIQLLAPLEQCLTVPLGFSMSFYNRTLISHVALGIVQEQWDKEERPPLLTLSTEDHERGWKCLQSLGIPKGAWFVGLHVRESGWNDKGCPAADYRNADIEIYLSAIKSITDAGGWVIRMGDRGMKPLPTMPQVIDYAHSDVKSDWMDVFLCAQCRFCIATSSGLFTLSSAFGVPIVATNFLPTYAIYCLSKRDLFLPKMCWSKDKNRILNFKELFLPPVGIASLQNSYDLLDLKIMENTSEELKELVEEMLARFGGNLKYTQEDEYLQDQFRSMTADCGRHYAEKDVVVNARIGRDFLRKHAMLLPGPVKKESCIG